MLLILVINCLKCDIGSVQRASGTKSNCWMNNRKMILLFVDLSAAFDHVEYKWLSNKTKMFFSNLEYNLCKVIRKI